MHVVLPDPFGPTRPRISPAFRVKLRPSSARKPPKRLTSPSTVRSGSGDIDPPALKERDEAIRQEKNEAHDQRAIDQLEILRRRDADSVVDAVEDNDAEDRPDDRGIAAEQREYDGEDRELAAEHGLGVEDRHVPGKDAAGKARNERTEQPGDDAFAHHVDARHAGADRVLADGLQRHAEMRVAEIDDQR